jgi:hypothetical protein
MRRCPHCSAKALRVAAVLRSTKQRPVRCSHCQEFAFLPAIASVPFSVFVELALVLALALAAWFSGVWLFSVSLLGAIAALALVAFAWPLSQVPPRNGKVSIARPSNFYSGNP